MAPATTRSAWGSLGLQPAAATRWPKTCVSVPCAVTMLPATTTVCGPARAARPFLREAFKVRHMLKCSPFFHQLKCSAKCCL